MKNINKNIFLLALAVLVMSCDESEEYNRESDIVGNNFVYLAESNASEVNEAGSKVETADGEAVTINGSIQLIVRRAGDLSQAVSVGFTTSAQFISTTDFQNAGDDASSTVSLSTEGTIEIPAGAGTGSTVLTVIDDVFPSGDKEFVITLTEANNGFSVGLANNALFEVSQSITVVDDDCPVDLANFTANYSMGILGADGNDGLEGFDLCAAASRDCSGNVVITPDPSDPTATTLLLDHPSFGSTYVVTLVTCSQETTVVTPLTTLFGVGAWNMQQGAARGIYSQDGSSLTIIGVLGTNGDFEITLTKN